MVENMAAGLDVEADLGTLAPTSQILLSDIYVHDEYLL